MTINHAKVKFLDAAMLLLYLGTIALTLAWWPLKLAPGTFPLYTLGAYSILYIFALDNEMGSGWLFSGAKEFFFGLLFCALVYIFQPVWTVIHIRDGDPGFME